MEDTPKDQPPPEELFEYTAFEKRPYSQVIYKTEHKQSWRSMSSAFYRASDLIINEVANRRAYEDIEGLAGIFLFRHYLELIVKKIVINGRWLKASDQNAALEDVKMMAKIHELGTLWKWALEDAKPKFAAGDWERFDVECVEKCIADFDSVDPKGFAFRYWGAGGEFHTFDFRALAAQMSHIQQVLDGIDAYLVETYSQNADWQAELESQFGGDAYW